MKLDHLKLIETEEPQQEVDSDVVRKLGDKEYEVWDGVMQLLQTKLEKLNQIAGKVGAEPIHMEQLGQRWVTSSKKQDPQEILPSVQKKKLYHHIKIIGGAPKIEGWEFLGTLQHSTVGTVVKTVPGKQVPQHYFNAANLCQHCNRRIERRTETFIVQNISGHPQTLPNGLEVNANDTLQVGRFCLKDFLGHINPNTIAEYLSRITDLDQLFRGMGNTGPKGYREPLRYDLEEVLTLGAAVVRVDGHYMSKKKSQEIAQRDGTDYGPQTTPSKVFYLIEPPYGTHKQAYQAWEAEVRKYAPTDADKETGKAARQHVLQMKNDGSEYMSNMIKILSADMVEAGHAAYALSALALYGREQAAKQPKQQRANQHLGQPGERIQAQFTIRNISDADQPLGYAQIHVYNYELLDQNGNVAYWSTSKAPVSLGVNVGDTINVDAKVKAHKTSGRGLNYTLLGGKGKGSFRIVQ